MVVPTVIIEGVLDSFATANPEWSIAILRIFNPAGLHTTGQFLAFTLKPLNGGYFFVSIII